MANTIKHKRGSGSNPAASSLSVGELAIRTDTGVVFTKKDDGTVAEIAGGGETNLGVSTTSTAVTVTSDTGNNATISEASSSAAGVMSAAHHDKLDGIESGATADQTKSDIDALGIDADTVDGVEASSFLRSDAADTKTSGDLSFSDSVKAKFGTGNDLEIQHNGTDSYITQLGTGDLYLQNTTNDKDIVIQSDNGSGGVSEYIRADGSTGEVNLYHYGSKKFNTTSSGINITGNIAVSGTVDGRDVATDGTKLDGIATGATANSTESIQDIVGGMVSGNTESGITVTYQDGDGTIDFSVASQTDNNFTTTLKNKLDGIESGATADQSASEILTLLKTVDGEGSGLDADRLDGLTQGDFLRANADDNVTAHTEWQDGKEVRLGNGADMKLYHNAGANYIDVAQDLLIRHGTETMIRCNDDADVELYYNNSKKLETKSDGVDIVGELQCDSLDVDGAADITGTVTLHGNLDLQDSDKILLGSGDDLQIYHDGSHSYIYDSGTGNLTLRTNGFRVNNAANSENIITANQDGEVNLFYNNSNKLQTKSDGVNITGELQCDSLDVDGSANITGNIDINENIRHNGDTNTYFGFPTNDAFRVVTAGAERFRITSTGAIAIEGSSNYGSSGQVLTSNGNDAPTWQDGGGTVASGCVYENSQTISANYSVTSGKNAMSAGPITIASGVTVTVTSGSTYTIV